MERKLSLFMRLLTTSLIEEAVPRDRLEETPERILNVLGLRRIPAAMPQATFPEGRPDKLNVLVTSRGATDAAPSQLEIQTPRVPALQLEQQPFRVGGVGLKSVHQIGHGHVGVGLSRLNRGMAGRGTGNRTGTLHTSITPGSTPPEPNRWAQRRRENTRGQHAHGEWPEVTNTVSGTDSVL
jgi:hypothetical protein